MKRIAAAIALVFALETPAFALDPPQTYVVPVCATARGPHPLSGWTSESTEAIDNCATRGGFGGAPDSSVVWEYRSPDETEVAAVRIWRAGWIPDAASYTFAWDTAW